MVSQKYRWDFIGLSTDDKPTSETSDKVVNGSTYYCSDTSKLYVYCDGTWYERKPLGGGGGTSDFNELTNRPKYNGADMTGSTNIPEVVTYSDFTGTDGTAAGAAGLVPAPATTDAGKFLKADGTWDTAGSAINVVQTTGTSTTDVMSQNAVTGMVYNDPRTQNKIKIGNGASNTQGNYAVEIGATSQADGTAGVALGVQSRAAGANSVAIGAYSAAGTQGIVSFGGNSLDGAGYNNSKYRLIRNIYDGQSAHDAATVAQGNTLSTSAPTTSTVGVLGQLYTDTTNMHTYQCTAISGGTYTWTQRW